MNAFGIDPDRARAEASRSDARNRDRQEAWEERLRRAPLSHDGKPIDALGSVLPTTPPTWFQQRADNGEPVVTEYDVVPDDTVREDEFGHLRKPMRGAVQLIERGFPTPTHPLDHATNALGQVKPSAVGKREPTPEELLARMEGRDGESIAKRAMNTAMDVLKRLNDIEGDTR
jgi:hypothetical protein